MGFQLLRQLSSRIAAVPANPYDNAACESVMKTIKQEEIYGNDYRDFEVLGAHLEEFIGNYYWCKS